MTKIQTQRRTALFLHVATMGRHNEVLNEALNAVITSELFQHLDVIEINVVGDGVVSPLHEDKKLKVVRRSASVSDFEHPTLTRIQEYAAENPDSAVLYLNCLGGRYEGEGYEIRRQWRKLLYYLLIERYQHCLSALDQHDVCGVSWSKLPMPHMTSNNWWATGSYILRLPTPEQGVEIVSRTDLSAFGDRWTDPQVKKRHSGEFWIGMNRDVRPVDAFSLEKLGLPLGEFKSVSWWALPGINWEAIARSKLERASHRIPDFSFYKLVVHYRIRWVLKSFKRRINRMRGRRAKADTAL